MSTYCTVFQCPHCMYVNDLEVDLGEDFQAVEQTCDECGAVLALDIEVEIDVRVGARIKSPGEPKREIDPNQIPIPLGFGCRCVLPDQGGMPA